MLYYILGLVVYIVIGFIAAYMAWRAGFSDDSEYIYIILLWPIIGLILCLIIFGDFFRGLPRFFVWITNQITMLFIWLENKEESDGGL